jgi:hypothetical protein
MSAMACGQFCDDLAVLAEAIRRSGGRSASNQAFISAVRATIEAKETSANVTWELILAFVDLPLCNDLRLLSRLLPRAVPGVWSKRVSALRWFAQTFSAFSWLGKKLVETVFRNMDETGARFTWKKFYQDLSDALVYIPTQDASCLKRPRRNDFEKGRMAVAAMLSEADTRGGRPPSRHDSSAAGRSDPASLAVDGSVDSNRRTGSRHASFR